MFVVDVEESLLLSCLLVRTTEDGTSCSFVARREREPVRNIFGMIGGGECDSKRLVFTTGLLVVILSSRSSYKFDSGSGGGGGGGIFSSIGGRGGGGGGRDDDEYSPILSVIFF